jgi:hypothetical protein
MPLDPAIVADLLAAAAGHAGYDPPSTLYLAALTSEPSDIEQGTECSGDGYNRAMVTPATLMVLVSGTWQNGSDIVFAAATADWPDDIVAISAYPAGEGTADRQWYFVLAEPVTVASGKALRIPAGDLTVEYPS